MGSRKRKRAELLKEAKKSRYVARLGNCPTSPRKMRLVADMIKGEEVNRALDLLRFSSKTAAKNVEKLLLSAVANWQAKNEKARIDDSRLYVRDVFVDQGRTLKRIRPAPQGRAYRIRKRSNHVTIVLDSLNKPEEKEIQTK